MSLLRRLIERAGETGGEDWIRRCLDLPHPACQEAPVGAATVSGASVSESAFPELQSEAREETREEAAQEREEEVSSQRRGRSGSPVRHPEAAKRKRTPRRAYTPSPPRAASTQRAGPSEDRNTRSGSRAKGGSKGGTRGRSGGYSNSSPHRYSGSPRGGPSARSRGGARGGMNRSAFHGWASQQPSAAQQMSPQASARAAPRANAVPTTEEATAQEIPIPNASLGLSDRPAIGQRFKRNKSEGCSTFRSLPSAGEDTMDSTEEDPMDSTEEDPMDSTEEDPMDSTEEDSMDSTEEDTMDSTDSCTYTELCESGGGDVMSSIIDAGLQKWLQENWNAKISESPTQDRDTYKIGVSEEGSLNANLWITERSVEDFRLIYSIICRNYQDLKIFPILEEAEIEEDSEFFQAIGISPDTFINKLLGLIKLHQKSEPIFFFSPFNYEEKGTELFSKAFSDNDLSPEDNLAVKSETEDTFHESTDDPKDCYESDGFKAFPWKKKAKNKKSKDGSGNELEDTSAILFSSEDHALPMLEREDTVHYNTDRKKQGFNKVTQGDSTKSSTDPLSVPADEPGTVPYLEEEKNTQRKKLEEKFLDALYCLAKELFAGGGKFIIQFIWHTGFLKEKIKALLANIPELYTEDQIVWYLNKTSELLLADVIPLLVPPHELPSKAQELLKSKVQSLLTDTRIKYLFERKILRATEAAYEVFQKSKANKEIIFRILEDLTRILTNASQETTRY